MSLLSRKSYNHDYITCSKVSFKHRSCWIFANFWYRYLVGILFTFGNTLCMYVHEEKIASSKQGLWFVLVCCHHVLGLLRRCCLTSLNVSLYEMLYKKRVELSLDAQSDSICKLHFLPFFFFCRNELSFGSLTCSDKLARSCRK